jgi:hypothetical protein
LSSVVVVLVIVVVVVAVIAGVMVIRAGGVPNVDDAPCVSVSTLPVVAQP